MALPDFDGRVWRRRGLVAAAVLAVLLVVVGLVGFFVVPGIVKSIAEKQIAEQLGRKATIGAVHFNPFLLAATIDDFVLYEADGTSPFVKIDELQADVSSASLFKRALVLDRLTIARPTLHVVRLEPQRFDFSDILDRLAAQPKSDSPTRFSLNNIELDGGTIDIDDRVTGRKHRVDDLRIALPFVSNLPYDAAIFVTPDFRAKIDGSPIALTGKAQPFSASRESSLDLKVDGLDLTEYVDLAPVKLPARLTSGKLSAALALTFRAATKDAAGATVPQSLGIGGHVAVAALALADRQGRQAIAAKSVDVDIDRIDPFNGTVALKNVAIAEPTVDVTRRADGTIDLVDLFRMPATATATSTTTTTTTSTTTATATTTTTAAAAAASPPSNGAVPPPQFTVGKASIGHGSVRIVDQTVTPATTFVVKQIDVEAGAIALAGAVPTTFHAVLATDGGATLDTQGSVVVERRDANGTIDVKGFEPARVAPYLASFLAARIDDGSVDVHARFHVDASKPEPSGGVDDIAVHIAHLRTSVADTRGGPFMPLVAADAVTLDAGAFDLATRAFTADTLTVAAPTAAIRRDAKGRLNLRSAVVEAKPVATHPAAAPAVEVQPVAARPFTAVVKTISIERGDVSLDDLAVRTPVHVRMQHLDLKAGNVGTSLTGTIPFKLAAQIDRRGHLAVDGHASLAPLDVEARVDANQVAVGWLAAYVAEHLNIVITSADLNTKGALRVTGAKNANEPPAIAYRGSFGIARMRALDKLTSDEFMSWNALEIPTVDVHVPPNRPIGIALGQVRLSDFYVRVILNADGRLNLQDVLAPPGSERSVTTPESAPTPAPTPAPAPVPASAATSANAKPSIRIAGITLANGRIGITDNFIRPNYSADLTELAGDVGALATNDPKPAALTFAGRINGEGTLDIKGSIDPLAPMLYADIEAEAKDIELTRLTAYSIKYAGYGIERGKLSTTVKYHIENGKLQAQNRLFLDQLTFGDHDPNSKANLPVKLAVALLANSKGEIDIELPVSGTLSDPEFSIGGVLWHAFVNLITRAVTSPFALIGSAFGGGSHGELGYIQFKPGVSDLTDMGKSKLETLAKALADRPKLKLDIIGRYDPATDPDGIKRDHLLDRLKDAKAKTLPQGADHVPRSQVTIEPGEEYTKYLTQVYDDTKLPDKPRNAIGLAKSIPDAEMERLLLANIKLDPNDPRWLAEARADVVRHYIEGTGKIAPGRVFLVAPKLTAAGIDDGGAPNRVDFAIR